MHRFLLHLCPFAIGVVYICLKFDPRECKPLSKFLCIHAVQVIFTALYRLFLFPFRAHQLENLFLTSV